jgi:hypothetical protein
LTKPVAIVFLFLTGIVLIVLSQPIGELEPLKREEGVLLLGIGLIGTGILFFVIPKLLNKYRKRKESKKHVSEYKEKSSDNIVTKAQEWLNIIRFQSSYSSGWSGSLKLPIGIEGGMNVASSLSQKQLSLPEIIADYRNFIKLVAQEYRVIIGIDELDKLPSGEKAHRFLNEIKGIFGLENCFYLLSVSESALSSFDRRGLPFRNVFDSSFDDMIHVPYLNLEAAKTLIKRRVIGMPIPFVCFCYCMSGGLARDLIRTCRNLLEQVHQAPEKNSLSTLCSSLIKTDIKSKLRATSAAAKDNNLEPELTNLLKEIQHIETSLEELPPSLLKCCDDLSYGVTNISAQQHEYEEVLVKRNKITSLRDELGSYLYYAVTMLDFFNKDTDVATFKEEKGLKALEQLAKARQSLSISPGIARSVITDLRELLNMDIFETQSLRPKRNMESKHSDGNTNL